MYIYLYTSIYIYIYICVVLVVYQITMFDLDLRISVFVFPTVQSSAFDLRSSISNSRCQILYYPMSDLRGLECSVVDYHRSGVIVLWGTERRTITRTPDIVCCFV